MKKQFFLRILMLVVIISAGVFVVAAVHAEKATATEECAQEKEDCFQPRTHSEFLLESLTRTVLAR